MAKNDGFGSSRARGWAACVALCLALGCHGQEAGKGPRTPADVLTAEQAQAIFKRERGEPRKVPAPTSVGEVMEILRLDDSERFGAARDFLARLDGVDALAVRATLEMLWASGQLTVSELAREGAKQLDAELSAGNELLKLNPNDAQLKKRLARAQQSADRERRLKQALETLALPHWEAGLTLAREVVRRNPERPDGYVVLANLYRLHEDWVSFQENIEKAEALGADQAALLYARALERATRLRDRAGAREGLQALLAEHPGLARAQAQLVLLQDDIEPRYAELRKLEAINPNHALVLLEGKNIQSQYETAIALRAAQAR
jgi:hypothetical protein